LNTWWFAITRRRCRRRPGPTRTDSRDHHGARGRRQPPEPPLAAARARGRQGGPKFKMTPTRVTQARAMYDAGKHTVQEIAETFGVSRPTIYRHLDGGPERETVRVKPSRRQ